MNHPVPPPQPVISVLIYAVLVIFFVLRQLRERRIRVGLGMWFPPVILAVVAALPMFVEGVSVLQIPVFAAALIIGIPVGRVLSTHANVRVDRAAGQIFVKASPLGIILFAIAFIARVAVRLVASSFGSVPIALTISSAMLWFAVGIFIGMRLYWQEVYARTPAPAGGSAGSPTNISA